MERGVPSVPALQAAEAERGLQRFFLGVCPELRDNASPGHIVVQNWYEMLPYTARGAPG